MLLARLDTLQVAHYRNYTRLFQFYGNQYKVASSPNGEQSTTKIHTDKELAKLAGVGTGTVARFNRVMKSDDEELKRM